MAARNPEVPGPPKSNGSTTSAPADQETAPHRPTVLRVVLLVLLVGAWLAIGAVGGPAIGSLSSVQSNDQKTFLPPDAESVKASEAAAAFAPVQALPAFVVFATSGGPASPDQLASWAEDGDPAAGDGGRRRPARSRHRRGLSPAEPAAAGAVTGR